MIRSPSAPQSADAAMLAKTLYHLQNLKPDSIAITSLRLRWTLAEYSNGRKRLNERLVEETRNVPECAPRASPAR
jgi:hypothetical protein